MACRLGGIFAARRGPEAGSCRDRPAQVFVIRTLPLGINRRVRSLTLGMSLKGLSAPVRFNKKTGPLPYDGRVGGAAGGVTPKAVSIPAGAQDLPGRITFTPRRNEVSGEIDGYEFEAPTRFDKLFTGIAVERPKNLDPDDR